MKKIFIISAPSGTGKTTIALRLKEELQNIYIPVTYTTKKPRTEEVEGKDYRFVSQETFSLMIKKNKFLEWAKVYGNYYGTPKDEILLNITKGKTNVMTSVTQRGLSVKNLFSESVLIGLLPPSVAEQEKRIRGRSKLAEKDIKERINATKKERKILFSKYDFRLINKNSEDTLKKIINIITKGKKI